MHKIRPFSLGVGCTYFGVKKGYNGGVGGRADQKMRREPLVKKRTEYTKDLPHRLYTYFISFEGGGAPSFVKFARSIGVTLDELSGWRKRREFDRAWRECSEIRRDYLIDAALTRRLDGTFTKYLLERESEESGSDERGVDFTLRVVDE